VDALRQLWVDQYRSYRSLPGLVQVWVAWLVTVNLVVGADRSTPTGRAVLWSNLAFMLPNTAIVVAQRGYGSALSFPHLVAWPPLVVWLLGRLREDDLEERERVAATLVAVTNSISLAFDVVDAARFLAGERDVAGEQRNATLTD
jgi:hypothetical protein